MRGLVPGARHDSRGALRKVPVSGIHQVPDTGTPEVRARGTRAAYDTRALAPPAGGDPAGRRWERGQSWPDSAMVIFAEVLPLPEP
ncbi:hypothetical protein OV320_1559 [Actinobacteria bacterium OV320]|nr:hypothetical protein OV320_1559 [Actinobacteria bacterium OV320]